MIKLVENHVFNENTDLGEVKDLVFTGDAKTKEGCFNINGTFIPYDPDNPVVLNETAVFEAYFEAHKDDSPPVVNNTPPAPSTEERLEAVESVMDIILMQGFPV